MWEKFLVDTLEAVKVRGMAAEHFITVDGITYLYSHE